MAQPHNASGLQRLKWSGWTDRGRIRSNNEDAFIGLQFDSNDIHHLGKIGKTSIKKMDCVFAVSDGMGGALAGEYASRIAVEKIIRVLPRSFKPAAAGLNAGYDDLLTELFGEIHKALAYLGASYEECSGMEATLSVCWFTPGWMYFGHIGDSRIYYLPAKSETIKQLSHDDTHVGWLFRNGKINEREARSHPRRSVLQKALGGENQFIEPQAGAVGYEKGDIFLLCTDGLTEGLYNADIISLLRDSKSAGSADTNLAHRLVQEALLKGARDNATAVVIHVL